MPSACIYYESGTGRERVALGGAGCFVGTAAPLRGRSWQYELTSHGINQPARGPVEASIDIRYTTREAADRLAALADRDMANGTPGALVCDGWRRSCLLAGEEVRDVFRDAHGATLKVLLLDGVWRRSRTVSFKPSTGAGSSGVLDLPHDLPHDLAPLPAAPSKVEMQGLGGGPVGLVVYGPAVNPYVVVGGNTYKVTCSVPDGGYLTVDPVSEPKRVYLTDAGGTVTDHYADAELGDGEGSGEYVFERLPHGFHAVSWAGSFGFDLVLYEESGWLPWTS